MYLWSGTLTNLTMVPTSTVVEDTIDFHTNPSEFQLGIFLWYQSLSRT